MLQHLKFSAPDWIFCILASLGLSLNVVQSFLLPEALSRDVLRIVIVSAIVIAVMVLCSYNKKTVIISAIIAGLGIILVLLLAFLGIITGLTETADAEANTGLWYVVVILSAAFVYLLSRTRVTSWILLIFGILAAAYFLILEYTLYLWAALLFMAAVGAWICFVGYRRNMLKISAMRTAFRPMVLWSALTSLLCLAFGFLLWFGIVRPLQPPTMDIYLLIDAMELNRVEQLGLVSDTELYDESLFSDWLNENLNDLTNQALNGAENPDGTQAEGSQQEAEGTQTEEHSEVPEEEDSPPSSAVDGFVNWITYNRIDIQAIIALGILIALLLALVIVLFLNRRKIWYRQKTRGMDDEAYIRFFYPWFLKRLKRLKLPRPHGDTPLEYAKRLEPHVRFLDGSGVTWGEISEIFARTAYSGLPAKAEDREKFEQFYHGFFRCCRKKKKLAWIFYTFRI